MVIVLVLLAKLLVTVHLAAEISRDLASLVLASFALHINMVLVLVLLTEKRDAVLLAAEISVDLASLLLAVSVEPRSAYERPDLQRQRPGSSQSARSRNTIDADEGAGSEPAGFRTKKRPHAKHLVSISCAFARRSVLRKKKSMFNITTRPRGACQCLLSFECVLFGG
jgi:hypothetical protein